MPPLPRMEKPVILLEAEYARCLEYLDALKWSTMEVVPAGNARDIGNETSELLLLLEDPKWQMILKFMGTFEYRQTFRNEKFAIYR